jgi:anti-sigma B factor antagonist
VSEQPVSDLLTVTPRRLDSALVLAVTGEIDMETAPALSAALATGFEQAQDGPLILDLTAVAFLGSSGLAVLLRATGESRQALRIVVDSNRPVIRPIEVTGLDGLLALFHTVEEALAATTGP